MLLRTESRFLLSFSVGRPSEAVLSLRLAPYVGHPCLAGLHVSRTAKCHLHLASYALGRPLPARPVPARRESSSLAKNRPDAYRRPLPARPVPAHRESSSMAKNRPDAYRRPLPARPVPARRESSSM